MVLCLCTGLLFNSKDALKLGLIDEECIYENNESDLKNEEKLLAACCDVLSNRYFNGELNAAARVKRLAKKEIIQMLNDKSQIEQSARKTAERFLTPIFGQYIENTIPNKNRSKL